MPDLRPEHTPQGDPCAKCGLPPSGHRPARPYSKENDVTRTKEEIRDDDGPHPNGGLTSDKLVCPDCGTPLWDLERRLEMADRSHRHHAVDCVVVLKERVKTLDGVLHNRRTLELEAVVDDWKKWMNRSPSLTPRQLLLDPNSAQIKVERYMVSLGRVQQGEVDPHLSVTPQVTFRPDRIVVHAHLPRLAALWWEWLLWWFVYPILRKTYTVVNKLESYEDEIDEDERDEIDEERERLVTHYKVRWVYPVRAHHTKREYRAQGVALSHSPMVSLRIGNVEILAGNPISLFELSAPGGIGPMLSMPTVRPPEKIEVEFSGTAACTFTVMCIGFAALT